MTNITSSGNIYPSLYQNKAAIFEPVISLIEKGNIEVLINVYMSERIQKILFPTDFSKNSENAFYYAINFTKRLKAEILVFHSFSVPEAVSALPLEVFEREFESLKKETQKQLNQLIEQGKLIEPSISFNTRILPGSLTDFVNDIIEEKNIDLIIMGTEGADPLKALFLGTNAAAVLEKALCPVLIVPKDYSFEPIHTIFFPSEYLDSDIKNTLYLSDIAESFQAEITIGNIADEDKLIQGIVTRTFEAGLKRTIKYPKIKFVCLDGKDVEKCISDYATKKSVDLIVMSTQDRSKLEKLFNRSLTKKVAYSTQVPLLAMHA